MEDPIEEWKIQEDSHEEKSRTAGWVLNKGLGLGKKILVTGFVISSAPLVLPPLLILSAFGFAVSVPYGILFASYACTETLMSKFLPNPSQPPLLLGYETVEEDEEEEDVGFGVGGEIDMEEEEEGLMEDTNGGVERRIELGEKGNEEVNEGKVLVGSDYGQGSEEEGGQILKGADEIVDENGHEEDVCKYVDKGEEKPSDEIEAKIEAFEGMGEEEEEELVVDDIDMEEEEEELMEDAKGGVEKRIELGEKGNEELGEGKVLVGSDYGQGSEEEGGQILKGANEIVDEDGYEEDVGKWVDKGEEKPSDEIEVRIEAFEGMGEEEEEEVVVEDIDLEQEEEELMEDAEGGVERRIELGEKGNEELGEGKVLVGSNYGQGSEEEGGQILKGANKIVDEDGCEEAVGKCVDKGEEKPSDEIEVKIEEEVLVGEEEEEKAVVEESKGEQPVEETPGSGVVIEGGEINNGDIEVQAPPVMRSVVVEEESRGEQPMEEMPRFVVVIEGEEIDNGHNEEQPPPLMRSEVVEENGDQGRVNDSEEEEMVRETRGLMEKNMDEGEVDYAEEQENGSVKMMHGGTKEEYNKNVGNVEEMEIPLEARGAGEAVEGKNDEEVPKESEEMPDTGKEENVDNAANELKPIKKAGDKFKGNNVDTNLEAEKPEVETRETINFGSAVEEEHKSVVQGEAMLQEGIKEEDLVGEEEEGVVEESRGEQSVTEPPGFVGVIEGEERENGNNEEQASPLMKSVVMQENGNRGRVNDIEKGELVRETRGITGENRGESKVDYAEEEDQGSVKMMHGSTKEGYHKNVVDVEEMEIPLEARGAGEVVEGKNDEEVPKESEEMWEPGKVENMENPPNEFKPIEKARDKLEGKNVDTTLEAEKPEVETRETINFGSNVEEEHKCVVHGEAMLQEGIKEDSIVNGVDEDIQLNRERENASFSNTGAREIADESGFVLFDDKKVAGQQYMFAGYETPEESEHSSCISHGSGNFMELPVSAKVPDSKRATIHSKKDNIMPLNEVSLGKKSWQEPSNEIEVKIEAFEEMGEEEEEEGVIEESRGEQQVEETPGFLVVIEGEKIDNRNNEVQAAPVEESRGEQPVEEMPGFVVVIEGEDIDKGNIEVQVPPVLRGVVVEEDGDRGTMNDIEEDKLVRETRGIMGKNRDESKADYAEEEDRGSVKMMDGGTTEGYLKNFGNVVEMEIPLEARGIGEAVEEKNDEEVPKESEEMNEGKIENVDNARKELKPIEKAGDKVEGKNVDTNLEAEKPAVERREAINFDSASEEEHKPFVHRDAMLQEGIIEDSIANGVDESVQLNMEKENASFSNADAREIADEGGFELFDDKKVAGQQYMYAGYGTPEESEQSSSCISLESGDFLELPVSARVPESKRATVHSKRDNIMPSSEQVICSEEKIWEQINGLRTIVGYKVAPHANCLAELKALYIFTGVEPPASVKDPSDLVEVNNKLQFLMSIVGVK